MALTRTEYWNLGTGTVRGGATGHGESLTDVENYLLPADRVRTASLYSWGVADGLVVTGTSGQAGVTVKPGAALDAAGHLIVLAADGFAVVDPEVDPDQIQDVPTVPVGAGGGFALSTAGLSAPQFLTITWREVLGESVLANAPVLLHAPWLRLVPVAGFPDTGATVVLAKVTLDAAGKVTALSAEGRRVAGVSTGRLQLRVPRLATAPGLAVDQLAGAELRGRPDGGMELVAQPPGGTPRTALSVDGATGNVGVGVTAPAAAVDVDRGATNDLALRLSSSGPGWGSGLQLRNTAAGGRTYGIFSAPDGKLHLADATGSVDRLVIDQGGNVSIGMAARQAVRTLQVEGSEVHSGGGGAGFSFANRNTGTLVDMPSAGERWVWYALDGVARLWSGGDHLYLNYGGGVGLDVMRRMRMREASGGLSAGHWLFQGGKDRAFIGMRDTQFVGFYGAGFGWGLIMDVNNGDMWWPRNVGQPGGPSTMFLWGSQISDVGGGLLSIHSGGGRVRINRDLQVVGVLSKGGGGFKIDHPLDPENKYLSHSFVESPEMLNVYCGTVVTDSSGEAVVTLPDYLETLNRDFCYQLTPVGALAQVAVTTEISDNAFTIRTDQPGVTVSWQVTGVRQDAWADANRIEVEVDKPEDERNQFLHPEERGLPMSRGIHQLTESAPESALQSPPESALEIPPSNHR